MRRLTAPFLSAALLAAPSATPKPASGSVQSLRLLPPEGEASSGLGQRLLGFLRTNLTPWTGLEQHEAASTTLATRVQRVGSLLHVHAQLMRAGSPLFRRVYAVSEAQFERVMTRLLDDVSKALTGKRSLGSRPLVAVLECSQGVSELVLASPGGAVPEKLTHHGSRTHSPTAVRKGRLAYITYVSGPPQLWGMDLKTRTSRLLYAPPKGTGVIASPALSPDGRTLAFVACDQRGLQGIRLLDWETGETRLLSRHALYTASPSWSPDGERLVFVHGASDRPERLVVLSLHGADVTPITQDATRPRDPSWSPDGKQIVFASGGSPDPNELMAWELKTNRLQVLLSDPNPFHSPRWCPTQDWMVLSRDGGRLTMFQPESQRLHPLWEGSGPLHTPRWVW